MYDATKCSLHDSVYSPWLSISTVDTHLRLVNTRTYLVDYDVGEMFLNFILEPTSCPHTGVDLSKVFP